MLNKYLITSFLKICCMLQMTRRSEANSKQQAATQKSSNYYSIMHKYTLAAAHLLSISIAAECRPMVISTEASSR